MISPGGPGLKNISASADYSAGGVAPYIGQLADEYDLIGLDPRGVGYSDNIDCEDTGPTKPLPPTASAKDRAKAAWDEEAAFNKRCTAVDPAFVHQLTTSNIARDVDSLRAALGESRISFYGVSYGTAVGANYRSLFDGHVDRMWLDAPPSLATALPAAIRKVTDKPVTHIIYSHSHADHIANAKAFGDVIRIAHSDTAATIRANRDPNRPMPTATFSDRRVLTVGGQVSSSATPAPTTRPATSSSTSLSGAPAS